MPSADRRARSAGSRSRALTASASAIGSNSASTTGPSRPNVVTIASLATSTTGSPQASISVGTSEGFVIDRTTPTVARE
jgi:hypothetical protein